MFRKNVNTHLSSASKSECVLGSDQKSTASYGTEHNEFNLNVAQKLNFDHVGNTFQLNPQVNQLKVFSRGFVFH